MQVQNDIFMDNVALFASFLSLIDLLHFVSSGCELRMTLVFFVNNWTSGAMVNIVVV